MIPSSWTFSAVETQMNTFLATDLVTGGITVIIALGLGSFILAVVRRAFG